VVVITPLAAFAGSAVAGERLEPTASVESGDVAADGEDEDATCDDVVPVELTGAGEVSSLRAAVLGLLLVDVTAEGLLVAAVAPAIVLSGV
jgi:hypothetical protein